MDEFRRKFIGYPEDFYRYGIPFDFETGLLDESFKDIADKIRHIENVPGLIRDYSLPESKSFKRIIYNEPGFLFYIPELAKTWKLVEDINLLNKLLKSPSAGYFLSVLHSFPKIEEFFYDYKNTRGAKELVKLIDREWIVFINYGMSYLLKEYSGKASAQKNWNYKYFKVIDATATIYEPYSVLKPAVSNILKKNIVNDVIGDFRFVLLRSTGEYFIAGDVLHNCLKDAYRWVNSDVVGIYNREEIVGAIELSNATIVEARTAHNRSLCEIEGLEEAFLKWNSKYGFVDYTPEVIIYSEEDSIYIGLMYNTDVASAPIVTCKKAFCESVDEALKQFNGISCMNNPSLSRILFHITNLYDEIPAEVYTAVAEIFAKVYKIIR